MKKITFIITVMIAFLCFAPGVNAKLISVKNVDDFWPTLESAGTYDIVQIESEMTISLKENKSITKKVYIGKSSGSEIPVTFDLNGYTLNVSGNGQLFVQSKGNLIITDSVGTGKINNDGASASISYMVQVKGKCEINGGTLENNMSSKTALYIQEGGACELNNGTIINTIVGSGQPVSISKGLFTMNGGKVESKAVGNPQWKAAVEGGQFIMNGGVIEAAGTGVINYLAAGVIIRGGTINAEYFGFRTNYLTIEPAAGKEVVINAKRAIIDPYEPNRENPQPLNIFKGGTFNSPILLYTPNSTSPNTLINLEVHDGVYSGEMTDLDKYVVEGKYAEKSGSNYVIKEYSQEVEVTPIDPEEPVEDATVGLVPDEELEDTLMDALESAIASDPNIQEAVSNNNVVITVEVESVPKTDLDATTTNNFKNAAEDLVIADYFDVSVVVNDEQGNELGTISQLSKEIELMIVLPEKYINKDENVNRKYYVLREHDGIVEIIDDVIVSEDGKSIKFKSNKFSTYALAYEDQKIGNEDEILPPNTGDINVIGLTMMMLFSAFGIAIVSKKKFAKNN